MRLACFRERLIGMTPHWGEIKRWSCRKSTCANGSFYGAYRPKGAFEITPGATREIRNKPGVRVVAVFFILWDFKANFRGFRLLRRFNLPTGYLMRARADQPALRTKPKILMDSSTEHTGKWKIHMNFRTQIGRTSGDGITRA